MGASGKSTLMAIRHIILNVFDCHVLGVARSFFQVKRTLLSIWEMIKLPVNFSVGRTMLSIWWGMKSPVNISVGWARASIIFFTTTFGKSPTGVRSTIVSSVWKSSHQVNLCFFQLSVIIGHKLRAATIFAVLVAIIFFTRYDWLRTCSNVLSS